MSRKTQSIKSLIVISIIILGASCIYYLSSNHENITNSVFVKENQETKVKKELESFEKSMITLLQKDEYDSLKSLLVKASKNLQELPEFIALKEDLEIIIQASDTLKNKKAEDYQSIIDKLKLHSDSNILIKREAEDLTEKIENLGKEQSNQEETTTVVQSDQNTKTITEQSESAQYINSFKTHAPVSMDNISSLPDSLIGYPIKGNIYPEEKRGTVSIWLATRDISGLDDPHNLIYRLAEIPGYENAVYLDVRSYEYMKELGIRAYAYYTGSDYLDWKWIATYFVDTKQANYFINPSPRNEDPSELDYDVAPMW